MSGEIAVFWFRRDLRLFDNCGLYHALQSGYPVLPLFIFDTDILDHLSHDDRRVVFIHQRIFSIQSQLTDKGTSLLVLHGTPLQAFETLLKNFNVKKVFTNHDYEPYAINRDSRVTALLSSHDVSFHSFKDQVIFEKNEIVKKDNTPYHIFTPYANAWKTQYLNSTKQRFPSENHIGNFLKTHFSKIPTLEELGFADMQIDVSPATAEPEIIRHYDQTRNIPSLEGTTRLSVHLRFGTVSIRELAAKGAKWNQHWLQELIWREFFMMILYHYPSVVTQSFKPQYDNIEWRNNETEFDRWCKGRTGYPLVDAGMRELNETGFMHNRVRMVVASFLTKHLLTDWRWGESYFAEKLLDYELASNNGNWQWAAGCGCDAAPYFRIFNPTEQQKKFDPQFKYIRRWIPDYTPGYIEPMVDHEFARKRALETYKRAVSESK